MTKVIFLPFIIEEKWDVLLNGHVMLDLFYFNYNRLVSSCLNIHKKISLIFVRDKLFEDFDGKDASRIILWCLIIHKSYLSIYIIYIFTEKYYF